jgi:hypothetical protein
MWICIGVCRGQVASSAVSFYQLRVSSTAAQRVADTRRPHSQRGAPVLPNATHRAARLAVSARPATISACSTPK